MDTMRKAFMFSLLVLSLVQPSLQNPNSFSFEGIESENLVQNQHSSNVGTLARTEYQPRETVTQIGFRSSETSPKSETLGHDTISRRDPQSHESATQIDSLADFQLHEIIAKSNSEPHETVSQTESQPREDASKIDPQSHESVPKAGSQQRDTALNSNSSYQLMNCTTPDFSEGYESSPEAPGKFMAVYLFSEHLTKSRMHLAEVMAFAKSLKRTLILPRCGGGHIGNGIYYSSSICLYFDTRKMGEYVPWVSEDYFLKQVTNAGVAKPSTFTVFLKYKELRCNPFHLFSREEFPENTGDKVEAQNGPNMRMLRKGKFVCSDNCPVGNEADSPLELMREKGADADVIVVGKSTPLECLSGETFESALRHVHYAPQLHQEVDEFVQKHLSRRFLAIHWRMEMAVWRERQIIGKCAAGLVRSAKEMGANHDVTGVFLATDITLDDLGSGSKYASLGGEDRFWLKNIMEEIHHSLNPTSWKVFNPEIDSVDSGVKGVLDKLVCSQAFIFLYPPAECFAYHGGTNVPSSYTREILSMRNAKGLSSEMTKEWEMSEQLNKG